MKKCGFSYAKWMGQCGNCGAWNSLLEQEVTAENGFGGIGAGHSGGKKSALKNAEISGKKTCACALRADECRLLIHLILQN